MQAPAGQIFQTFSDEISASPRDDMLNAERGTEGECHDSASECYCDLLCMGCGNILPRNPVECSRKGWAKEPPPVIPKGVNPPADTGPRASFTLDSPEEMAKLGRNLEVARSSCVHFLNQFARGESKDEKKAAWAAAFLAEIRSDEEQSILALCANIGKGIPTPDEGWGAPHSLSGRGAAWALVRIGGSRAKDTMMGRMRHELSEYELRTYAYVFSAMDKQALTIRQLELAIEREKKTPVYPSPDKKYLERLEFIKDALSKPGYLSDQKNWPSQRL